jgi:glycogen debranching enzyme
VPRRDREVETGADGLSVLGRDGVRRTTRVRGEPAPRVDGATLLFEAGPAGEIAIELELSEEGGAAAPAPVPDDPPQATRAESDSAVLDALLERSLSDLRTLRSDLDGRPYYAAGIPWFVTLFGRDSLIAALQTLAFTPEVAEGTLRSLAGRLGEADVAARDEEPGKVPHELRVGEPAALEETPFARYYGSVDATPLFLCVLCEHARWSGSLDLFRELRAPVEAALGWLAGPGDRDGDGLLEYERRAKHGLEVQGWKDSPAGTPGGDGRPLAPPVALAEPQGYAIRARRELARLFDLDGDPERAASLRADADTAETALERLWLPGRASYAIGLDRDKRPGAADASNQGHLLWSGAVRDERARAIRHVLLGPELFSGWGIRTLGSANPAFDPLGYHTGSVWPHDTALIAAGLRLHGFDDDFTRLLDAMLDAAASFEGGRLPELFGGLDREPGRPPVPYPVACRPQAWAAGAIPFMLTAALGLRPDALEGRLEVVRPLLPAGVKRLELTGMRVGDARLDLAFEGGEGGARLADARYSGGASSTKISNACSGSKTIWL